MSPTSKTPSARKVALVTGASAGIGQATARALREAGYVVFGTSRRASGTETVGGVRMLCCDITSETSVADVVREVEAESGRIDLLVNNAGVGMTGAAEESSMEQIRQLFDTNVYGTMRMTHAVLPIMRRQGSGRIVNLSSILGLVPAPFSAHYSAAKHAIEGYSESLDHEVRALGIRVTLIEPGLTRSSFDQSSVAADRPIAAYAPAQAGALKWLANGLKTADTSASVAATILRAVEAKQPKMRYTSGKGIGRLALLRRLVPASAFDKSLRQQMNLP